MFKRIPSHFVNWVCYAMSKPLSERFGKPILNKFGKKIYLDQMTTKEIEERVKENDIVILPVGSTEAHGPLHLLVKTQS